MVRKKIYSFAILLSLALSGCGTSTSSSTEMPGQNVAAAVSKTDGQQVEVSKEKQPATTSATSPTTQVTPSQSTTPTQHSIKTIHAKVTESVDGDTIKVSLNGKEETIRFLLVDTPETHHPRLGVQPFGKEAAAFTKSLVEGKTVELEQDVNNGPDKYGRLLYYVYVDGKSVQEQLLEKGLARVAYIYVPNVKYVDKYRDIQKKAQQKGVGIWSIENYAQENGYHSEVAKKESNSPQAQVKTPEQIKQEVHEQYNFNNCTEARAAGVAPLHRGQPGYKEKLDRDHDGVACE